MKLKYLKPNRRTFKTYSALEANTNPPTAYEIVTTGLLYYPKSGFAVKNQVTDWYKTFQYKSCDKNTDWNLFSDPKHMIYTNYIEERKKQEQRFDELKTSLQKEFSTTISNKEWRDILETLYAPLVFPIHGLQMVSAYIGQMAPTGRVSICAAFQAADEMSKIQHIAYHTAQIRCEQPTFAHNRQLIWEENAIWQPFREAIENLLITYDWIEALIALNLCMKPLLNGLFLASIEQGSKNFGNPVFEIVLKSVSENEVWHMEWATQFIQCAALQSDSARLKILAAMAKWEAIALEIAKSTSGPLGISYTAIEARLRSLSEEMVKRTSLDRKAA